MRSVWNGTIAFGQVSIPIKAYSATEERGTGLHQLHLADGGRIKLHRTCETDGADVPFVEMGRGYELPGGDVVMLTEDELADLPLATAHTIDVHAFTPLAQIDPMHFNRSYYLAPEPPGLKPYALLAEALRQTDQVAVVKVALRQRETLAMLRERDHVIVLTTMLWPDEIRTPDLPILDEDVPVHLRELRAAVALVAELSGDFTPSAYTDEYGIALRNLIQAKVSAGDVRRPTAAQQEVAAAEFVTTLRDATGSAADGAVDKARAAVRRAAAAKAAATRAARRAAAKSRNPANRA
ncbi:MAG TPA: Ku protein [Pseudonocardiaceae bacterium]|jgi:DNA end-binding protein Ku|nr:Ku protein [Pseudonocardiaceae bacterium]